MSIKSEIDDALRSVIKSLSSNRVTAKSIVFTLFLTLIVEFFILNLFDEDNTTWYKFTVDVISTLFPLLPIYLLVNKFLQAKLVEKQTEKKLSEKKDIKVKSATIVGLLALKKSNRNNLALFCLLLASLISYLSFYLMNIETNYFVFLFIFLAMLAIFISQYCLEYRIRKGLYGTNEYEAREIIKFILKNSNDIDFSDGQFNKGLFPKPDKEKQAVHIPKEGEVLG